MAERSRNQVIVWGGGGVRETWVGWQGLDLGGKSEAEAGSRDW